MRWPCPPSGYQAWATREPGARAQHERPECVPTRAAMLEDGKPNGFEGRQKPIGMMGGRPGGGRHWCAAARPGPAACEWSTCDASPKEPRLIPQFTFELLAGAHLLIAQFGEHFLFGFLTHVVVHAGQHRLLAQRPGSHEPANPPRVTKLLAWSGHRSYCPSQIYTPRFVLSSFNQLECPHDEGGRRAIADTFCDHFDFIHGPKGVRNGLADSFHARGSSGISTPILSESTSTFGVTCLKPEL